MKCRRVAIAAMLLLVSIARAQTPIALREAFAPGATHSVQLQVDVSGQLTLPPQKDKPAPPMTISGTSKIDYDERLLTPLTGRAGARSIRNYRTATFSRTVGQQTNEITLRPALRRLVVLHQGSREVPFSPDGPLMFGEFDMVRTDVYTPALAGLLPEKPVQTGERWAASAAAVEELTDMDKVTEGTLECRLESIGNENGRRLAKVRFSGKIRGLNEDGPNEQQLDGDYSFDLDRNYLAGLNLRGVHLLLDPKGNSTGKVEGKFRLDRRPITEATELSDAALKNLALEPNSENTLLVYESNLAGVRFLYPRRWRVSSEHEKRITLEEPRGNGVLITIEAPAKVPTVTEFLKETQDFVTKEKGKVVRVDPAQTMRPAPGQIDRFGLDVEIINQAARMEYFIVRHTGAGATIAARLIPSDAAVLRGEVEQVVKSLEIRPVAPAGVTPLPSK